MEKKKVDFSIGIFDNLTQKGLEKIKSDISNCEIYGIGVYTDNVVINDFYSKEVFQQNLFIAGWKYLIYK